MKKARVLFTPSQKEVEGEIGRTILDLARKAGVYIDSQCNGKGKCGKCRVRVLEGDVSLFVQEEAQFVKGFEQEAGYRLACMTRVRGDAIVLVPGENVLTSVASRKMFSKRTKTINPAVKCYHIDIDVLGKDHSEYVNDIIKLLRMQYGLLNITIDPGILEDLNKEPIKSKDGHLRQMGKSELSGGFRDALIGTDQDDLNRLSECFPALERVELNCRDVRVGEGLGSREQGQSGRHQALSSKGSQVLPGLSLVSVLRLSVPRDRLRATFRSGIMAILSSGSISGRASTVR